MERGQARRALSQLSSLGGLVVVVVDLFHLHLKHDYFYDDISIEMRTNARLWGQTCYKGSIVLTAYATICSCPHRKVQHDL